MKNYIAKYYNQLKTKANKHPFSLFFVLLVLLLGLIIAANTIRSNGDMNEDATITTKPVEVYRVGDTPKHTTFGKVEKGGTVTIVAQTSGIVQNISVNPGQEVSKGKSLVSLSNNYYGGNAMSLQRQLAEKQYNIAKLSEEKQTEIIDNQKNLAEKNLQNNDELRQLTEKSLSDTRDQLTLNEDILSAIDENLTQLQSATNSAQNQDLILSTKQLKSQYVAAANQLRSAVRSSEYQVNTENPPQQLAELQKEIALKQLDLQKETLSLQTEIAKLQLSLARVNESLMYPGSPFAGTVERVHVKVGEQVNPGTPLISLSGNSQSVNIVALVSRDTATAVSYHTPSDILFNNEVLSVLPNYISTEATDGKQYSVLFSLPDEYASTLKDNQYIPVHLSIGYPDTSATTTFIPIDTVFQTQDSAYIFTVGEESKVETHEIELGTITGQMVQVLDGIEPKAEIVMDRSVLAGDVVEITN